MALADFPPTAQAEVQRILDNAARRLLDEKQAANTGEIEKKAAITMLASTAKQQEAA